MTPNSVPSSTFLPYPVTIEQIIECNHDNNNNENEIEPITTHVTIPALRLMMIGCEESNIYGPNENIAVSVFF